MANVADTRTGTREADPADAPHWFWTPFLRNKSLLAQVILAAVVSNVLALGSSLFIMVVYDKVIPNNALESLAALAVGMVIVIGFDFVLRNLRGYFIDIVGRRADTVIGRALFRQLLGIDLAARRGSTGSYANTVKEFDTLRDFFASATVASLVDLPFIVFFVWVIWIIGGPVALVLVIAVPVVLVYAGLIQPLLSRSIGKTFRDGAQKHSVLVESVSAMETLRSVGGGAFMTRRWDESVASQSESGMRTRLTAQTASHLAAAAQQAVQVGIICYGALLIQEGEVTMGALVACVILSGRCMGPLAQVAGLLTRAQHAVTAYRSLDRLMRLPSTENRDRTYLRRPEVRGRIEFRNVTFRYPDAHVRALDDVSFVLEPGQKLAILGRIGSGKSTIVRLAMGLYDPDEGAVLIDDTDIRQFHPDDRRRHVGALLQDSQLLSGTVRENIAIGAEDPSDEEILHAAAVAGAHDFIGHLPSGYDLRISERGEGLSGGQRQALGLARALVGRPRILLLDEPTSALDTRSEMALIERLKTAAKDRTVILVTHKSTLLELVDKVMVVDGGKVVAFGGKAEIMARLAGEGQGKRANG